VNDTSHGSLTVTIDGTPRIIPLTGMSSGTPTLAHIGINGPQPGKTIVGSNTMIDLVLRDDLPRNIGLTNATVSLNFTNDNILTVTAIDPKNGWKPTTQTFSTASPVVIPFTIDNNTALTAGTVMGTVIMQASVGLADTGSIYVSAVHFNDKLFEDCTLKGVPAPDTLDEHVVFICGDSTLQDMLNYGTLKRFSIRPNPAHKVTGSAATLEFTTETDQDATIDLLDISGKTIREVSHGALNKGEHSFAIPTSKLAEGTYFARVKIGGARVVRKFVLQNE
jgi:hypothetical protein